MTVANGNTPNLKGLTENGFSLPCSAPRQFYYLGRVGPKHWLPRSSNTGTGPMGFVVKWFIVYPSVVFFGAGLAIMLAPFYGLFWVVRRSFSASLFSCLGCSVRHGVLSRGRTVSFRPSGRFGGSA